MVEFDHLRFYLVGLCVLICIHSKLTNTILKVLSMLCASIASGRIIYSPDRRGGGFLSLVELLLFHTCGKLVIGGYFCNCILVFFLGSG